MKLFDAMKNNETNLRNNSFWVTINPILVNKTLSNLIDGYVDKSPKQCLQIIVPNKEYKFRKL